MDGFKKTMIALALLMVGISEAALMNITVRGQLACGDRSVRDAEVELWERDTLDPNDFLNSTKSDSKGSFYIYGEQDEVGNIEPYLLITHNCDGGVLNPKCKITDRYEIPKDRVNKVYDMGIISLNIIKDRKKHCV